MAGNNAKNRTADEKCRLVTGFGPWHIGGIRVSDGPHGVRAQSDNAKNNDSIKATCFPTASAVACSWDRDIVAKMAAGIAREAKEAGVSVVLGPGVNIKRSPLCGRNFEYYSEDPYLAGTLAAAFITAMQDMGVGTSLKHFAGNSQETHRMTSNSMIDERALFEIYLSAFEMSIREASPATVMASYNMLNGIPACENRFLLTDVLRNRWGYEGLVMSDWGACVDLPACIAAGMDVEMPDSCGNHFEKLRKSVADGKVSVDTAVSRIDRLCGDYPAAPDSDGKEMHISEETRNANHELAKAAEEMSAVLLKNDSFLPLSRGTKILIVGDLALDPRIQGGGSSHINTGSIDKFEDRFAAHGAQVKIVRGYRADRSKSDKRLEEEAVREVRRADGAGIPVLFFGGLTDAAEGEGYDRRSFGLPANQTSLLRKILEVTDNIGFISFGGSPYDMELPSKCRALLQMYLGGEAVASACASLVFGDVSPSGKLAESIPLRAEDCGSYGFFGEQGGQSGHPDDVMYAESIFVGYRYYDTFGIPVRYCFGHGMSYTSFEYSDLSVSKKGDSAYEVSFFVKNTGACAGREISQVYVKNPATDDFRPGRELRGYASTYLGSGEMKKVSVTLGERAFSAYLDGDFKVIAGTYEIQIGASLDDIRLAQSLEVAGEPFSFPLTKDKIPLSAEDFDKIYPYGRTDFSHTRPGQFSAKNSLIQMSAHSRTARFWCMLGRIIVRFMYPFRPMSDPELMMTLGGILEGNIDNVCNQSGGLISPKMMEAIIASANRKSKRKP